LQLANPCQLARRIEARFHFVIPACCAIGAAAAAESPVSISTRSPALRSSRNRIRRIRPQRIARIEIRRLPRHPAPSTAASRPAPEAQRVARQRDAGTRRTALIAQQALVPLHARRQPAPGQNLRILRRSPFSPRRAQRQSRKRQRMIRPLLGRRRHAQQIVLPQISS
jgi:hypothetical protein